MKSIIDILIRKATLLIMLMLSMQNNNLSAEGTKQLMPASSDFGNLEIYDMKRPFAAFYNENPLNRLYFHVSSTSEKVYFGFRHIVVSGINNSTTYFRIKNPSGEIVFESTIIPTSAGTGYIETYAQAAAGPKIGGSPSAGYNPFNYTPNTTGDFYIEFKTDTAQGTYYLDYFDLTVVNSGNQPILGRLWSNCWDISTRSFVNGFKAKMYVLSDDGYISKVNFNGIQPFGFTIACNNTGPGNLSEGNNDNRESLAGNSTRPMFKIFLNDPDPNVYPSGTPATLIHPIQLLNNPFYGDSVYFTVNMSLQGVIQIILNLNGVAGYQPGTTDVALVQVVHAGLDTLKWDGKNGLGDYVAGTVTILMSSRFSSGTTHLPIYDPENNPNGYIVSRVRPNTGTCQLYWDDSGLGGTTNIDTTNSNGHRWSSNFGDVRTMNTWWDGSNFKLNDYEFEIEPLPIELLSFNAIAKDKNVDIKWTTSSETNNDYFTIEKSLNGIDFTVVGIVQGAGNSNEVLHYTFADDFISENRVIYYRLKQTDFDGAFEYVGTTWVNFFQNNPILNPVFGYSAADRSVKITFSSENSQNTMACIYDVHGKLISSEEMKIFSGQNILSVNTNEANNGLYIVQININGHVFTNKVAII